MESPPGPSDAALGRADALSPWAPRRLWPEVVLHSVLAAVLLGLAYLYVVQDGLSAPLALLVVAMVALLALRSLLLVRENRRLSARFSASDAFKTQLLRFISHEIANPLSPLKVQAELLRQGAPDPERSWKAIDRSLNRLESLSRDVRLMALAETGRIVQQTVVADVVPRISSAVQAHQGVAAQRGVALRGELPAGPLVIPIDGERFDQVVDNLLSNALKFTPKGGHIELRVFRSPAGLAVFEVHDSGAGMTAEQQEKLFSAFGRPEGSSAPGLGLGLYLCKAIVEGHGGRITATSEGQGRGSRFRVELPVASTADLARRPAGPPRPYVQQSHGGSEVRGGRPPDLPV